MTRSQVLSAIFLAGVALLLPPSAAHADGDARVARTYEPYAELLERFLREKEEPEGGLVSAFDYRAALDDGATEELLAQQDERLADYDVDRLSTREEAIAFWLNAYNYFMIAHILRNPVDGELIDSVKDYGSFINRYEVFKQDHFSIGDERYSLDQIEKDILLGDDFKEREWFEARVHFAVNCASVGCPPLREVIYTPDNVDELLTENTRRAFNTPRHLHLDGDTLMVTELFDWYEDDFEDEEGSVEGFVREYADDDVRDKVDTAEDIDFIDYDWTLNAPEHLPEFDG